MKVTATSLPGVLLLEPQVFPDDRGFFLEAFRDEHFAAAGIPASIRQVNQARSTRGVLRGLHYQLAGPQGKLVSVLRGTIWDVAVDIRVGSPHFGRWIATTLDADSPRQLWIPPGFAHGYCVLSDIADVVYLCTGNVYDPADDRGIPWDDATLAIQWPVSEPKLSRRDASHVPLAGRNDLPQWP